MVDLTPVPGLSDEEKELLISSWSQVETEAESVGAVTFLKYAKLNQPDLSLMFQ